MAVKEVKTKVEIIEILDANGIDFNITTCGGSERICISLDGTNNGCNDVIIVQTCNKDTVCRVHINEIMFIAIENKKSVLYLTDKKIETHYPIDYWKETLDEKSFAQPHYSYIVNLHYVEEVTKDFVTLRHKEDEYKVYTSMRKIGAFKKAVLEFGCGVQQGEK